MVNETFIQRILPPIQQSIETVKIKASDMACDMGYDNILVYFIVPIITLAFLLVLIRYKEIITDWIYLKLANRGYIWIDMILSNKHIKSRRIKLDSYNRFKIGKKSYVLDNLDKFIIGYKKSMPVFIYNEKFVLPLCISDVELTEKIKKVLNFDKLSDNDKIKKENVNKVRALELLLDTHILNKILSKKLISDLYSISPGEMDFKRLVLWVIVGAVAFGIAYYMGWIELLLSYVS